MYQRYIANPDGTFRKTVVDEPAPSCPPPLDPIPPTARPNNCPLPEIEASSPCPPAPSVPCPPDRPPLSLRSLLPETLDVGDLLLVLILLLLLIDSEEEDSRTILLVLAAFFLF